MRDEVLILAKRSIMMEYRKKTTDLRMMRRMIDTILLMLLAAMLIVPVSAGEKYLGGSPELSAAVRGSNEFYPGDDVIIPVVIQNSGLVDYTFTYPTTLTPADMPSTAK